MTGEEGETPWDVQSFLGQLTFLGELNFAALNKEEAGDLQPSTINPGQETSPLGSKGSGSPCNTSRAYKRVCAQARS